MRCYPFLAILLILTACVGEEAPSSFANHPLKRRVNIDDHDIYIVPQGGNIYVAWGGEEDRDSFVKYRQQRGIELISHCRVKKVISAKTSPVLRAEVKC